MTATQPDAEWLRHNYLHRKNGAPVTPTRTVAQRLAAAFAPTDLQPPEGPHVHERDIEWEAQTVAGVIHAVTEDADEFVRRAQERVHPGPVLDFMDRDFDENGIEEALDGGGNYCAWGIQQAQLQERAGLIDDETSRQKQGLRAQAMTHFAAAYQCLRQAQDL